MPINLDLIATPVAILVVPVLLSLLARDALVFLSVTAVSAAGVIAALGIETIREQWLVTGLMTLAGMIFTVHGYQTRRTVRTVERLKEYLVEVRVATTSLRNTIELERERPNRMRPDPSGQETT
jgi:hypothetical protein